MNLRKITDKHSVELKKYTSIKIGGRAKSFFLINALDEIRRIICDLGFDFYILGKGSNLLIRDCLIQKPVIKLGSKFNYIINDKGYLKVGASTPLSFLVKYCFKHNLGGLENLAGIPATVGGLLVMNASSYGVTISDRLKEVDIINCQGQVKTLDKENITFGYRTSSLKDCIILGAKFDLSKQEFLKQRLVTFLRKRLDSQDFSLPSCGSIFKNSKGFVAGSLIDSCGLKGARKGKAQVSTKHANFIVNLGSAKYNDVDYLIQRIKHEVYKRHNVLLEEEIKRWV